MSIGQRNVGQIIWGVLLIAMGLLLFVREPYALRAAPTSGFLSFARYFIAVVLILAGGKKLHRYYFLKPPSDE